ncbi:3'-5' exonuclease [Prochlorothrix hollandica]|uniref:3'-5' exonuclease n=1 Tax=Prochlorothrix hollandica TaxID=1223 RepID=UPI00034DE573|nr:exonuclease domain-containing protein [Prochlorothrix hollandica]
MLLLIIDFETTGLDPQTHFPIELGAILYSVEHQTTLAQASILIPVQDNPAQKVNRINAGAAQAAKNFQQDLLVPIGRWMQQADYLVAHNAEFDRKWIGLHGIPNSSKP